MSSSASFAWDPDGYLSFADERGRPFVDLIGRIASERPRTVVDLGCGTGNLTTMLATRWPDAKVVGVDSSEEMVRQAPADAGVDFVVGDIREWRVDDAGVDVLVSNAALQWIPDHLDLLPALVESISPGGWLAFQVLVAVPILAFVKTFIQELYRQSHEVVSQVQAETARS